MAGAVRAARRSSCRYRPGRCVEVRRTTPLSEGRVFRAEQMAVVRARASRSLGAPALAQRDACSIPLAAYAEPRNPLRLQTNAVPPKGVQAVLRVQRFVRQVRGTEESRQEQAFAL